VRKNWLLLFVILAVFAIIFSILKYLNISIVTPQKFALSGNGYSFSWNSKLNVKQKANTCGAFSSMAVKYIKTGKIEDPYIIYESFRNKMPNGYIYPWSITRYLSDKTTRYRIYNFWLIGRKSQAKWIENKLNEKKPVIAIIGNNKYLHYITIVGYRIGFFYVYDSEINGDLNGSESGNITIPNSKIINLINSAKFKRIPVEMVISEK
jgi:hypothetical protein